MASRIPTADADICLAEPGGCETTCSEPDGAAKHEWCAKAGLRRGLRGKEARSCMKPYKARRPTSRAWASRSEVGSRPLAGLGALDRRAECTMEFARCPIRVEPTDGGDAGERALPSSLTGSRNCLSGGAGPCRCLRGNIAVAVWTARLRRAGRVGALKSSTSGIGGAPAETGA